MDPTRECRPYFDEDPIKTLSFVSFPLFLRDLCDLLWTPQHSLLANGTISSVLGGSMDAAARAT